MEASFWDYWKSFLKLIIRSYQILSPNSWASGESEQGGVGKSQWAVGRIAFKLLIHDFDFSICVNLLMEF